MPVDLGPSSTRAVVGDAPLQHLPGNQRAALLLFDVLGFSAAEIATTMDTSTASVNSAPQRARAVVTAKIPADSQQRTLRKVGDTRLREIVAGYVTALEAGDVDALVGLLTQDVTRSMPPMAGWYHGVAAVTDFARHVPLGSCGSWQHREISANGQPAVASYLRGEDASEDSAFDAWSINVFALRADRIAEITRFLGSEHFAIFGLPIPALKGMLSRSGRRRDPPGSPRRSGRPSGRCSPRSRRRPS